MISEESLILGALNFYYVFIFTADTTSYVWHLYVWEWLRIRAFIFPYYLFCLFPYMAKVLSPGVGLFFNFDSPPHLLAPEGVM